MLSQLTYPLIFPGCRYRVWHPGGTAWKYFHNWLTLGRTWWEKSDLTTDLPSKSTWWEKSDFTTDLPFEISWLSLQGITPWRNTLKKYFEIFLGYDYRVSYAEAVPWKNIFNFSRLSLQAMTPWRNTLKVSSQLTYPRKVVGGKKCSHNWLTLWFFQAITTGYHTLKEHPEKHLHNWVTLQKYLVKKSCFHNWLTLQFL